MIHACSSSMSHWFCRRCRAASIRLYWPVASPDEKVVCASRRRRVTASRAETWFCSTQATRQTTTHETNTFVTLAELSISRTRPVEAVWMGCVV